MAGALRYVYGFVLVFLLLAVGILALFFLVGFPSCELQEVFVTFQIQLCMTLLVLFLLFRHESRLTKPLTKC